MERRKEIDTCGLGEKRVKCEREKNNFLHNKKLKMRRIITVDFYKIKKLKKNIKWTY